MKITINDQEYDFRLRGTVGLVYLAERMLGCSFENGNRYHTLVMYYCCLVVSNKDKDVPDLAEFISSLTTASLNQISDYFWARWNELEGNPTERKEEPQGED